ncbi:MAG TPA: 50S ribosomal protein L11 methyltransferase [Bauldia sp.]|nr:50S ribosomal protein L11 methyltransferase [Bauldia sp.]
MTIVATIVLAEAPARALAAALDDDGLLWANAFDLSEAAPEKWQVAVYFQAEPGSEERAALARLGAFAFAPLPEEDWVAKSLAGLAPVRAGPFLVHGSHDRAKVRANDIGIEIEAGLAFGTGHHGTTAGCLLAIDGDARARPIRNALDVGTGSGVLAIALAKRAKARVMASDIDAVATQVARDNVRLNGVSRRVHTLTAAGLNHAAIEAAAPYDLIVANILAGPLVALAPAIRRHLAAQGTVILSGLLLDQERRVAAMYRSVGLTRERVLHMGEWATLVLRG